VPIFPNSLVCGLVLEETKRRKEKEEGADATFSSWCASRRHLFDAAGTMGPK